ncbi:MAG: hypothetical protein H7A31_02685 [Thermotogae bacterium]|nr:hypothetical protein [Thermotogota bacterium]HOO75697.1 hypothetical protein [Tepiditoga sp.]
MDVVKELEKMIQKLMKNYSELKAERDSLKQEMNGLSEEKEQLSQEKELLVMELEEIKNKNNNIYETLTQLKTDLLDNIGEDLLNADSSEF